MKKTGKIVCITANGAVFVGILACLAFYLINRVYVNQIASFIYGFLILDQGDYKVNDIARKYTLISIIVCLAIAALCFIPTIIGKRIPGLSLLEALILLVNYYANDTIYYGFYGIESYAEDVISKLIDYNLSFNFKFDSPLWVVFKIAAVIALLFVLYNIVLDVIGIIKGIIKPFRKKGKEVQQGDC